MRVTTFVIFCCALQKVNETDEIDVDQKGDLYEKSTTTKEYEAYGDFDEDVTGDDVKVKTLVIRTDAKGHESIWEKDVLIKKKGHTGSSAESVSLSEGSSQILGQTVGFSPYGNQVPRVIVNDNGSGSSSAAAAASSAASNGNGGQGGVSGLGAGGINGLYGLNGLLGSQSQGVTI
ncbi:unnamed protein product, partial [Leptidea sinapis]